MQIRSELALRLPPASTDSNRDWPVTIGYARVEKDPSLTLSIGRIRYGTTALGVQVDVPWAGSYRIIGDNRIEVDPLSGAAEENVALYITGLVLAFLLRTRALLTLHGSAVCGDRGALALVGKQGSGKSTTAAALAGLGYQMLCDDIIPIAEGPRVLPGIPQPKLLPDAYEKLVGRLEEAGHLFDGVDKYQVNLGGSTLAADLGAVFILEAGDHPEVFAQALKGAEKLKAVLDHVSTFAGLDDISTQFNRCADRLGSVPVFRIHRPAERDSLTEVVDTIAQIDKKRMHR